MFSTGVCQGDLEGTQFVNIFFYTTLGVKMTVLPVTIV